MTCMMRRPGELLRSEIRRYVRLYPREQLAERIAELVENNYEPLVEERIDKKHLIDPSKVMEIILGYFGLMIEEVIKRDRHRHLVHARKVLIYFLVMKTKLTLSEIGELLQRDHTSIMHCRNDIVDLAGSDPKVQEEMILLNAKF